MCKNFWLLIIWSQIILADSVVKIVFTDIQNEIYAKDIVNLHDIHFVNIQGRQTLSGAFSYNQIMTNMQMHLKLDFEKPDKTRFEMLNLMIDVCQFLNGTYNRLKVTQIMLNELSKQKGFPKKCPIEANKTFTLENYEFDVQKFPLPNLKFIFAITLYKSDKKEKILYTQLKGATKR